MGTETEVRIPGDKTDCRADRAGSLNVAFTGLLGQNLVW